MLNNYFVDLHIHIGRDIYDKPVKITASKTLTLTNILKDASRRKGLDMVGVIDAQSPAVIEEVQQLIEQEKAYPLKEGGIQFEDVTLILGAEVEVYDEHCHGPIHVLCFLPTIEAMQEFSCWLSGKMKNITLSSQRYYGSGKDLQYKVKELAGLFIPAHVFTPFKSMYGKGVESSLTEVFDADLIDAIELGLSSDTKMADQIKELHDYTFISNSDSHSLPKIAREYQQVKMKEPSFKELYYALHNVEGRSIVKNYGMNPMLGKYYTTVCQQCFEQVPFGTETCSHCKGTTIVNGVYDRILQLKNNDVENATRPPYLYQVPLEYLPGLGPKTYENLIDAFETEMNIIHHVAYDALIKVVRPNIAKQIIMMREGMQEVQAGGGGKYGKINKE